MLSLVCIIIGLVLLLVASFPALPVARFNPLALGLVFVVLGAFLLPRFAL